MIYESTEVERLQILCLANRIISQKGFISTLRWGPSRSCVLRFTSLQCCMKDSEVCRRTDLKTSLGILSPHFVLLESKNHQGLHSLSSWEGFSSKKSSIHIFSDRDTPQPYLQSFHLQWGLKAQYKLGKSLFSHRSDCWDTHISCSLSFQSCFR